MNDLIEWEEAVWAVAPRDVISAVGVDTERYLHSQLSQQIEGLSDGDRVLSLLLEPTGKVIALIGVLRRSTNEFVIDCDPGDGEQVLARLQRFLLRVDVALTLVPADAATPDDVEHSRVAQGWPRGGHEIIAGETIPASFRCWQSSCHSRRAVIPVKNSSSVWMPGNRLHRLRSFGWPATSTSAKRSSSMTLQWGL